MNNREGLKDFNTLLYYSSNIIKCEGWPYSKKSSPHKIMESSTNYGCNITLRSYQQTFAQIEYKD